MYERVTPQQQAMVFNILAKTPSPESEQANSSKACITLNSSGCNEEASKSFNLSGYEFNPDTLLFCRSISKPCENEHLKKEETMEHWLACTT